ncbi:MAG: secondary thiamine-phosphate synthase enzyme YjbQ [Bacteroidota bacterium]
MEIVTESIHVPSRGNSEVIDITDSVSSFVRKNKMKEGNVTVFVSGSTASVTTTEYEPGLTRDIPAMLERVAPQSMRYSHNDTWKDGNGFSHVRAALMGPSITIPFSRGELLLGTWQQIVLVDHDNRPRQRLLVLQAIGT